MKLPVYGHISRSIIPGKIRSFQGAPPNDPPKCAETILLAAETGLAGGSIEDATGSPDDPIYPFELAVERVKAARNLPIPFTLTARAENLIYGILDLKDTVRGLKAFADAGADVLFAPGLKTYEDIAALVKAVFTEACKCFNGNIRRRFFIR